MNITGDDFVNALAKRCADEGKPPTSDKMIRLIMGLDRYELAQLCTFGEVAKWLRERNLKTKTVKS